MHLTEIAYAQALRDAQPPPERPHPMPGPRPAYMPPPKAAYDHTLASNFFQEFSKCARQAILLEARLDSGAYDNAPAIANFTERAFPRHQAPHNAPTGPRQPSDETRIHHERLEDECLEDDASGNPDEILRAISETLETAITQSRAAGLDLRTPDTSPPPRTTKTPTRLATPEPPCAATRLSQDRVGASTQARPRASPT